MVKPDKLPDLNNPLIREARRELHLPQWHFVKRRRFLYGPDGVVCTSTERPDGEAYREYAIDAQNIFMGR